LTLIDTPSTASATPPPNRALIAVATFCAVVKSERARLKTSVGAVSNPVSTVRSTVAPSGMRPVEGTPDDIDALVEYLYAETGAADADAGRAGRGRDLLSQKDCDTCHDFDGEGENDGPNLKGRGTPKWVAAVIADAGHPLLFTDRNKMPKFAGKLSAEEIEQMAKFVLGLKSR